MLYCYVISQVYTKNLVRSDKFKTGKEKYVENNVIEDDNREIIIGSIPVMVKSDLCWMKDLEKSDCDFDHGGYFVIKGAEKVCLRVPAFCLTVLKVYCFCHAFVSTNHSKLYFLTSSEVLT